MFQHVAVCFNVLQCVAMCFSVFQCVAACCSELQRVAVFGRLLQHVAMCCSVLQCVAVCCSVLQCSNSPLLRLISMMMCMSVHTYTNILKGAWVNLYAPHTHIHFSLQCVAKCVAVYVRVLQCVVVCACVYLCAPRTRVHFLFTSMYMYIYSI